MSDKNANPDDFCLKPGDKLRLSDWASDVDGGMSKSDILEDLKETKKKLVALQELVYAEGKHSLLVVLQAMDAAGKDSTIRHVIGPLNPQGVRVTSFKVPTDEEREHDFLWRIHKQTPRRGYISVFNRSHYEDVLIVRVKDLVPKSIWKHRFDHINDFESLLAESGTKIVKFYLNISKGYQKERLQRRLDRPDKLWKFNPADLAERARWDDYMEAFEDAISRCNSEQAPWYVIPAENRRFRDLIVAKTLVHALESLDMQYPEADFNPSEIVIG